MKRLLDCNASDFAAMTKGEKLESIQASEGRTIVQELSLFRNTMMLEPITDAEIACAFGADLILLNAFDCVSPTSPASTPPPRRPSAPSSATRGAWWE